MIFASISEEPSETPNCTSSSFKSSTPFSPLHSALCSVESVARSSIVRLGLPKRLKRESTWERGMETLQNPHWNTIPSTAFCSGVYIILPPETLLMVCLRTEKLPKVAIGVNSESQFEKIGWPIRRSNWARRMD